MKNQVLFSSKDKSKISKCCLLQFLFGALRVKANGQTFRRCPSSIFNVFLLFLNRGQSFKKEFAHLDANSFP